MKYVPLHCHSHGSILDGLAKVHQIVDRCKEIGVNSCAITDHGNLGQSVIFHSVMKKNNIKPILGCEFYITHDKADVRTKDNKVSHQIILAKNLNGWKKLIKLVSQSNNEENFYYKPRIDFDMIENVNPEGDLISFSGHPGSTLYNIYKHEPSENAEQFLINQKNVFGNENFYVEIQSIYSNDFPKTLLENKILRELAQKTHTKCIATSDSHYAKKEDANDHRVLLCSSLNTTLSSIKKRLSSNKEVPLESFFRSDNFHIPSYEECKNNGNSEEELNNTNLIAEMCENYNITNKPQFPKFSWTEGMNETEYLRHLCVKGWQKKNNNWDKDVYGSRVKKELQVFEEAGLAGYFLIVQDYVNYAKHQNILCGPGRGSVGGSLVAYLLNITNIDPIKYNLLFERFYNAGRNTQERVSLPDIDVDFPKYKRDVIIQYIREKYGGQKVCQMCTFGRLQGRGALKEVLRVHSVCSHEEMNRITKQLPQEHEIADHLEETGEASIIRWTLQNEPKLLHDWAQIQDDDTITGDMGQYFSQAIRLEGTYKSQGKHAAGIIISNEKLDNICPMILDKNTGEKISGIDMKGVEEMGQIKFDILSSVSLDKLQGVNDLLQHGRIAI